MPNQLSYLISQPACSRGTVGATLMLLLTLTGCATAPDYRPPIQRASESPVSTTVSNNTETLHAALLAGALGPTVTVRAAAPKGHYELVYKGNPEPFVDCGMAETPDLVGSTGPVWVPAASAELHAQRKIGGEIFKLIRSLDLTATAHIAVTNKEAETTQVELERIEYVLHRNLTVHAPNGTRQILEEEIRFHSMAGAMFTPLRVGQKIICMPTGRLPDWLLQRVSAIKPLPTADLVDSELPATVSAAPDVPKKMDAKSSATAKQPTQAKAPITKKAVPPPSPNTKTAKAAKPSSAENLASVQYRNDNKDPVCKRIVDQLFALDRHPNFDHDVGIRKRWQAQADIARAHNCNY